MHLFEYVADVALDGAHVAYDNAPSSLRFALFEVGRGVHNIQVVGIKYIHLSRSIAGQRQWQSSPYLNYRNY